MYIQNGRRRRSAFPARRARSGRGRLTIGCVSSSRSTSAIPTASMRGRSARRSLICRRSADRSIARSVLTTRAISTAIPEGTLEFAEAHVFGTVRFVLDIWERYFGRPIEWHFARDYRQLEMVILPQIDNAYAGYGFMEIGAHPRAGWDARCPYALNFDVMAHELGHLILYSTIGVPSRGAERGEYYGFQEAGADTTALIATLHFESLIAASARGDPRQSLRFQRARPVRRIVAARSDPARQQRCQAVRNSPPAGKTNTRCRSR